MTRLKIAGSIFSLREFFSFLLKEKLACQPRGEAAAQPPTEPAEEAANQPACLPALI